MYTPTHLIQIIFTFLKFEKSIVYFILETAVTLSILGLEL